MIWDINSDRFKVNLCNLTFISVIVLLKEALEFKKIRILYEMISI